ncbi:MAG: hypothetical protein IKR09_07075 [Alphaproteobacteria bacterium]|nr:hypothetical protein [Alphaproteobacteria bacterium]
MDYYEKEQNPEYKEAEKEYNNGLGFFGNLVNYGKNINAMHERVDEMKGMDVDEMHRRFPDDIEFVMRFDEMMRHAGDTRMISGSIAGIFRLHRYFSQKPEAKAKKAERLEAMLSESDIGRKSLDVLKKNGYSIDFDYENTVAPHIDPEHKKVMLNSIWSPESGALSLVHAARTVWQQETGKTQSMDLTVNAYLATAEVCQADAITAQLTFAEEMKDKNPKILKAFRRNGGNEKIYDAYKKAGNEKTAAVVSYLQEKSFRKEDWVKIECDKISKVMEESNDPTKFCKNKTTPEILKSVCKDYDGNCYLKGVKDSNEPARVSESLFRYKIDLMISPILSVTTFMKKNHRSSKSMGIHDIEFKDALSGKTFNVGQGSSHYYRRFYNPKEPGESLCDKLGIAKKLKNLVSGR